MRLQTEGAPNPADRHAAEPGGLGQAARAPMRLCARCTFQGLNHNLLDLSIGDFAGCLRVAARHRVLPGESSEIRNASCPPCLTAQTRTANSLSNPKEHDHDVHEV